MVLQIEQCEELYREAGQPAIFKLTPFAPPALGRLLDERGYRAVEPSLVLELDDLATVPAPTRGDIVAERTMTPEWTGRLSCMNGMSDRDERTLLRLFEEPRELPIGCFTLFTDGGEAAACGLGVVGPPYVGLFNIVTKPAFRNRGWGEQLLRGILTWAREQGATRSCLMVLRDNPSAHRVYEKLGYRTSYEYEYRVPVDRNGG